MLHNKTLTRVLAAPSGGFSQLHPAMTSGHVTQMSVSQAADETV